jgi:hypothetical protein
MSLVEMMMTMFVWTNVCTFTFNTWFNERTKKVSRVLFTWEVGYKNSFTSSVKWSHTRARSAVCKVKENVKLDIDR